MVTETIIYCCCEGVGLHHSKHGNQKQLSNHTVTRVSRCAAVTMVPTPESIVHSVRMSVRG